MKISFRIETRFRFMYQQFYFSGDFSTYTFNTWIKLPILQTIFITAIMNVDFIPSFIQEWNFNPSLHDSESTFHSGSSVQSGMKNGMNSIRNELDPEWVATQSGFMQTSIIQSPMISTETEWVRSGLKLNPDSCKYPLIKKNWQLLYSNYCRKTAVIWQKLPKYLISNREAYQIISDH